MGTTPGGSPWREDSHPSLTWNRGSIVSSRATSYSSVSLWPGTDSIINLESLVLESNDLVYYSYNGFKCAWYRGAVVSSHATGPASLIRRSYTDVVGTHQILKTAVLERKNIVHYWQLDGSSSDNAWRKGAVISDQATGVGCLIQSFFGGNIELVVLEGPYLVHHWRNSDPLEFGWNRGPLITQASHNGPQSFVQNAVSDRPDRPAFELAVFTDQRLVHFYRDHSEGANIWREGDVITSTANGPATILQNMNSWNPQRRQQVTERSMND